MEAMEWLVMGVDTVIKAQGERQSALWYQLILFVFVDGLSSDRN
jgi:hypothetical protein